MAMPLIEKSDVRFRQPHALCYLREEFSVWVVCHRRWIHGFCLVRLQAMKCWRLGLRMKAEKRVVSLSRSQYCFNASRRAMNLTGFLVVSLQD
jgi:hypothetical protein